MPPMPPIRWPVTSEADVGVVAAEGEPHHQYPIAFWCCVIDGSRGAVGKSDCLTWKCIWSKDMPLNFSMWKKLHPLAFTDTCWMFMRTKQWVWAQWGGRWCISAVATVGHSSGADFYGCTMQALVHWWQKWMADGVDCTEKECSAAELALSNSIILLFVSVVISMEINRRHYFWNNLYVFGPRKFLFIQCSPGKPKCWTPMI